MREEDLVAAVTQFCDRLTTLLYLDGLSEDALVNHEPTNISILIEDFVNRMNAILDGPSPENLLKEINRFYIGDIPKFPFSFDINYETFLYDFIQEFGNLLPIRLLTWDSVNGNDAFYYSYILENDLKNLVVPALETELLTTESQESVKRTTRITGEFLIVRLQENQDGNTIILESFSTESFSKETYNVLAALFKNDTQYDTYVRHEDKWYLCSGESVRSASNPLTLNGDPPLFILYQRYNSSGFKPQEITGYFSASASLQFIMPVVRYALENPENDEIDY